MKGPNLKELARGGKPKLGAGWRVGLSHGAERVKVALFWPNGKTARVDDGLSDEKCVTRGI
jgi:hypothetical protein